MIVGIIITCLIKRSRKASKSAHHPLYEDLSEGNHEEEEKDETLMLSNNREATNSSRSNLRPLNYSGMSGMTSRNFGTFHSNTTNNDKNLASSDM